MLLKGPYVHTVGKEQNLEHSLDSVNSLFGFALFCFFSSTYFFHSVGHPLISKVS